MILPSADIVGAISRRRIGGLPRNITPRDADSAALHDALRVRGFCIYR